MGEITDARSIQGIQKNEVEILIPTVFGEKKEKVLMIVIEKMIARYQNQHADNLDNEMFQLYEKAKAVNQAKDSAEFERAIKDL